MRGDAEADLYPGRVVAELFELSSIVREHISDLTLADLIEELYRHGRAGKETPRGWLGRSDATGRMSGDEYFGCVCRGLTPPKTRRSLRGVRLPHSAVAALLRHRELQDAERAKSSGSWQDRGLVFPNTLGGYADYTNLAPRHFKPRLKRAGLPSIRVHDLRHTCATLLSTRGGRPKIASEMLGHSNVSITLDVYSHMIPGLGDAAVAMEDALGS